MVIIVKTSKSAQMICIAVTRMLIVQTLLEALLASATPDRDYFFLFSFGTKYNKSQKGHLGDGYECEDIDECAGSHDCEVSEKTECANTEGTYTCSCMNGYRIGSTVIL